MKNAFTFAELMISLVIISVITALLYPTIAELAPNSNKHLFKSAYKTIENVVADVTNGTNYNNATNLTTENMIDSTTALSTENLMCIQFKNRLNEVGMTTTDNNNNVANLASCDTASNRLQTSDGMRWWFDSAGSLYVDVNSANNTVASSCNVNNLPWNKGAFCGNAATQDTFHINISNTGKITFPNDETVATQHLQNTTED